LAPLREETIGFQRAYLISLPVFHCGFLGMREHCASVSNSWVLTNRLGTILMEDVGRFVRDPIRTLSYELMSVWHSRSLLFNNPAFTNAQSDKFAVDQYVLQSASFVRQFPVFHSA
jgi:hypothetical protein